MNEELLNVEEVADLLRLKEETIIHYLHAGAIPAVRVGPFWRFQRDEVERWATASEAENPTSLKVLLVEDQPMQRELLAKWLREFGADVDCVGDGLAAVASLRKHRVDLLLLDLDLPGLNGAGVLEHTKGLNAFGRLWIMTAYGQSSIDEQAMNIERATMLRKPLVKGVVQELLQRERVAGAASAMAGARAAMVC
ncbi:MAG: excisionase family DNA binding protein [Kiritimatiellia bacterium]